MSILKQLSALVGIIAISFISIVWVSIAKLDEVYTMTNYSNTDSIPSMLLLTDEINHISILRAQAFKYQLLDTPQKRAKLEKMTIQNVKSLKKVFDKYEKLNLTPKGRELLAADKKDTTNYTNLLEKIRSLTKAGKLEEAKALMMHEHKTLVHKLVATVNKHNKYNSQLALKHGEMAKEAKSSADNFLIILATVVIVFALLLSFFIIKNILTAIHTIKDKIAYFVQEKDLNMKIEYKSNNEFKEIANSLNSLIETLKITIDDAKHSATENAAVSHELSATSELIDKNSKESTAIVSNAINEVKSVQSFIEETARISETTKAEILEVSEKLGKSKDEIITLQENISSASEAESEMSMKLDDLSRDAEQVKEVLSVISDIADQTNLLALNAAIEAARAGEHGRGFAVVADEVRKLAERTQKSLLEITASINVIVQSITEAASQMEQNAKNIQNLSDISSEVENTVLETNSVMQESISSVDSNVANSLKIAKDAGNIVDLVSNINDMTNQNAKSVEEITSAAGHLSELSEGLQDKLEQFKS